MSTLVFLLIVLVATATSAAQPLNSLPIHKPAGSDGLFYVEIEIGTPPIKFHLALDTVNPLTWVQCATCETCFPSTSPNYNPEKSITFQPLPPTHHVCSPPLAQPFGTTQCHYFLDGSDGLMALDTLQFSSIKLAFGCGIRNFLDLGDNNSVSGMIGLGQGHPASVLNQMNIDKISFCLPAAGTNTHRRKPTLDFGHKAKISGHNVQTASLFEGGPNHPKLLNLTTVTFNETSPGGIESTLFIPTNESLRIDTTSTFTVVSEDVYGGLRGAAIDHFRNLYGWMPVKAGTSKSGFDLCYKLPPPANHIELPRVGFHFHGGATFELLRLFQAFPDHREFCMVLLSKQHVGPTVLGSFQLMKYQFLFDFNQSMLFFSAKGC